MRGDHGWWKKNAVEIQSNIQFEWLAPVEWQIQTTRNYFPLFRHVECCFSSCVYVCVLFFLPLLPDCSSKLDLNGGRSLHYVSLVVPWTLFRFLQKMFVFFSSATKMNFRVFLWYICFFLFFFCVAVMPLPFYRWSLGLYCMWTFNKYDYSIRMRTKKKCNNNNTHTYRPKITVLVHAYAHIHI